VQWRDCDPAGIVYTPRFSDYIVEAYLEYFEYLFGQTTRGFLTPRALALPAKAISIEFRESLRPDQYFNIRVHVGGIRIRTFDLSVVAVTDDDTVSFVGTISLICLNHKTGKSQPLPDFLIARLKAASEAVVPLNCNGPSDEPLCGR
jgi:acyl-CoA thioesterase FadM